MNDEEIMETALDALERCKHIGAARMDGGLVEIDIALRLLRKRLSKKTSGDKMKTDHVIDALMLLENALDGDCTCLNATGLMPMGAVHYAYCLLQGPDGGDMYGVALSVLADVRARSAIDAAKNKSS